MAAETVDLSQIMINFKHLPQVRVDRWKRKNGNQKQQPIGKIRGEA